ncbi:MAG: sulfite exporter TauE/SafE family protein, partial [Gammaproteobacteria bacterium]
MAGRNTRRAREQRKLEEMEAAREAIERSDRELRQRLIVGGALLLFGLLLAAGTFVGPELPGPEAMSASLLVILAIGLTAGGLSCLAVQGGLLAIAVTGDRERREDSMPADLEGNAKPILWFLGAKLTAYTLLGALLGALGSLAQPSPAVRAALIGVTALLMIATALHFLGVHPVFRYAILQPPRFLTRRLRETARAGGAFA